MNFKHLLLPVMAIIPAMSMAETYYVTPEGAGEKNGSSWENAFGVEELIAQAKVNNNGDVYNFAGGVYKPSKIINFKGATGFTLNGNADGERTIFSGDSDDNNRANNGDASILVQANATTAHGNATNPIVINNIDFTCVYTNTTDQNAVVGALYIDNSGSVIINHCNFYNNYANGNRGGAATFIKRSTVLFSNCVFRNNQAAYRGGAVRLTSDNLSDKIKGYYTFDQCLFSNNKVYSSYGGAIYVQRASQLNIINSTMYGNTAAAFGSAIYMQGKEASEVLDNKLSIIGSTIANNTTTGTEVDAQITTTQNGRINLVNSIIVADAENTKSILFSGSTESTNFSFVSGGWNYVGAIADAVAEPAKEIQWKDTDMHGAKCTYAAVFGDNTLGSNGVIKPYSCLMSGATGAETTDAVSGWGIAANDIDYSVDQLGNERKTGGMNGAYADPSINTGVDEVLVEDNARLVVVGNGVYRVEGAAAPVEAYNIMGTQVAYSADDTISLEAVASGMYIIKSGKKVFKVIR